ncbi:hypothetical protein FVEN_g6771 [Fusarium venenatum]|uniref:Uncharacterized protein n=1 Tax=Fusarium venenatum TaxID=56646 RepID=A0A2L2SZP6_9HYPO|nr:uncharacterized protein FVRRES_00156 [Fusarium venenatum]KAG8355339.1 hypothetical protein FVEN_g6771 [Fusarium venenatum]CEI63644.1 unnamed protein product [Fusarium venenatum]
MVDGGAVGLGVHIGGDEVVKAVAETEEGEIEGQGDEEVLLGELLSVQVGALLLGGTHGVADDNGGLAGGRAQVVGEEEVTGDGVVILGVEGNGLELDGLAAVEVVGAERHVLGSNRTDSGQG